MPNRRHLLRLTFLFACVTFAFVDGKFYATREPVPPGVPYQQALLMFDEGKETLVLQSNFRQEGRPYSEPALGWVVPVPAVPEMASMRSEQAAAGAEICREDRQDSG